jgi:hypothetical protein
MAHWPSLLSQLSNGSMVFMRQSNPVCAFLACYRPIPGAFHLSIDILTFDTGPSGTSMCETATRRAFSKRANPSAPLCISAS